ncbi:MAG: hypothetical protein AAGC67_07180, partial [Myxococcota bacterium]
MARRILKILHELSAAGMIGALVCHLVVLSVASPDSVNEYLALRQAIESITGWILVPSLAVVLASGLLAIAVYPPFQNLGWVWAKALLGFPMFEGTLITIDGTAQNAARLAAEAARGTPVDPNVVTSMLASEWRTLWIILVLSIAQVVIGVWRPRQ